MNDKQEKMEYSYSTDSATYQTGSTRPPKNRMGLILVLLGLVIFLAGIVTALGFTNMRLFQALSAQQATEPNAIAFSYGDVPAVASDGHPTGLGFRGEAVSEFWHTYHRLPLGIFIQAVEENSDAARQGILPGDILTHINGQPVTSIEQLQQLLAVCDQTKSVSVTLYRDEQKITLSLQPPTE
jgi:membrane-associated protease RseP (regulator of RpoE activity)